jgi:serine/threonine protein kinase
MHSRRFQVLECGLGLDERMLFKNILFHSSSIASWFSLEEVYRYLGPPRRGTVSLIKSTEPAPSTPHVPAYIVITPDPTSLLELCLSNPSNAQVKLCDFSESFIYNSTNNRQLHTPLVYAAPEILLKDIPSPASDVWAFAVLTHVLVSGGLQLFSSYYE